MSNFPIEVFHEPDIVPSAPTFGISLGSRHRKPNTFDNPWQLAGAIFDSARHCLDYDFLAKNPDYRNLVGYIDTEGFNWLDFHMPDVQKIDLFVAGVRAAADFLRTFDWEDYKRIRGHLAQAHRLGEEIPSPGGATPAHAGPSSFNLMPANDRTRRGWRGRSRTCALAHAPFPLTTARARPARMTAPRAGSGTGVSSGR